jgi:hypothetical protein
MNSEKVYVLSIDYVAMERCFLVANILAEVYDEPYTEYGLIGLGTQSRPFHIVATPVLPGQRITAASVYQSGYNVFRLRKEVNFLSERMGQSLVPIAFIHRHPGGCGISSIDEEFLTGPFVDQVSTIVALSERRIVRPGDFSCCCEEIERLIQQRHKGNVEREPVGIDYSVCFSIIVNREREFSIYAARKQFCPFCKKSTVRLVPATLHISPKDQSTEDELLKMRSRLEVEMEAKLEFERTAKTEWSS